MLIHVRALLQLRQAFTFCTRRAALSVAARAAVPAAARTLVSSARLVRSPAFAAAAAVPRPAVRTFATAVDAATQERIAKVRALPGRLAAVLADLFVYFSDVYVSRHDNMLGGAVHDPCAVLALTHPQLFTTVDQHVRIETSGELTRGMTVIDKRGLIERLDPNCTVVWDVDAEAAFDVIVDSIGSFSN